MRVRAEEQSTGGGGGVVSRMREKKGMQPTTPQAWQEMREELLEFGVRSIEPAEANRMVAEEGYTLVDIRTAPEYEKIHAKGAVSAPLYRPITNWDARSIARRAAFAFFGVFNGTEESPTFLDDCRSSLDGKNAKVILYCGIGGSMTPTTNLAQGMQSRSLIACSELINSGYTDVLHMIDGMLGWEKVRDRPHNYHAKQKCSRSHRAIGKPPACGSEGWARTNVLQLHLPRRSKTLTARLALYAPCRAASSCHCFIGTVSRRSSHASPMSSTTVRR